VWNNGPHWINATRCLPPGLKRSPLRPKNRLISTPDPVAQASRLCNRAEEYGHTGSSERYPKREASTLEQGKVDRGKAAATTQTRMVHPDETAQSVSIPHDLSDSASPKRSNPLYTLNLVNFAKILARATIPSRQLQSRGSGRRFKIQRS
jgi:hypothetical protein